MRIESREGVGKAEGGGRGVEEEDTPPSSGELFSKVLRRSFPRVSSVPESLPLAPFTVLLSLCFFCLFLSLVLFSGPSFLRLLLLDRSWSEVSCPRFYRSLFNIFNRLISFNVLSSLGESCGVPEHGIKPILSFLPLLLPLFCSNWK